MQEIIRLQHGQHTVSNIYTINRRVSAIAISFLLLFQIYLTYFSCLYLYFIDGCLDSRSASGLLVWRRSMQQQEGGGTAGRQLATAGWKLQLRVSRSCCGRQRGYFIISKGICGGDEVKKRHGADS